MSPFPRRCPVCALSASWAVAHAGGDDGIRTHDPLLAGQVLSQLSYTPIVPGFPPRILLSILRAVLGGSPLKIEQQFPTDSLDRGVCSSVPFSLERR